MRYGFPITKYSYLAPFVSKLCLHNLNTVGKNIERAGETVHWLRVYCSCLGPNFSPQHSHRVVYNCVEGSIALLQGPAFTSTYPHTDTETHHPK